jgi:glutathione S-transferase
MSELTLYVDASWECPWSFHVIVALGELDVKYRLLPVKTPLAPEIKAELAKHAVMANIPCLAHGELWLTESAAVSEYLADRYPAPAHARIFPANVDERARARQMMSWLRTSLRGLRDDRPASSVFKRPVSRPLGERGRQDADELIRIAGAAIPTGKTQLYSDWSMADLDLAMMLMRLIANNDPVPQKLLDFALAQWGRHSVRKFLSYIPTST